MVPRVLTLSYNHLLYNHHQISHLYYNPSLINHLTSSTTKTSSRNPQFISNEEELGNSIYQYEDFEDEYEDEGMTYER